MTPNVVLSQSPAPAAVRELPKLSQPASLSEAEPLTSLDLQALADFLAAEMRHDLPLAEAHGAFWYQEQLGADVCSLAQAGEFRRRVIEQCRFVSERRRLAGSQVQRVRVGRSETRLRLVPRIPAQPVRPAYVCEVCGRTVHYKLDQHGRCTRCDLPQASRAPKPPQEIRALIGRPEVDVHAFTPKSAEGVRLFGSLPRTHTGWSEPPFTWSEYREGPDYQAHRFASLCGLALVGTAVLAIILR